MTDASVQPERANQLPSLSDRSVSLPVIAGDAKVVRPSRMSRWRAMSLIAVHVFMIAHILHWLATGRTLSPIEPSEAMYTLNDGHVNAGFVFFILAILSTLLLGRFVCGWGCHLVAYQDLCASLLKRVGIKPKPFRSRLLVLGPLALAIYMFVWPSAYRWWVGAAAPSMSNHLMKSAYWETFPGPAVAILTVAVCGFVMVYFLGAKGFCTYACPYGGFFGLADKIAPARIVVSDACEHCGHCTAVCSSNVKVHEEVALYGMVVDPGCMKCMDCVSVCPNDALHFGFLRPSLGARPTAPRKPRRYDFSLWEEGLVILAGLAAFFIFRGLYSQVPLLLSMGLAALTGYVVVKGCHLVVSANVRLQHMQLKRGGRLTRSGLAWAVATASWLGLTAHSGAVHYQTWRGHRLVTSLDIPDAVWSPEATWWASAPRASRERVDAAIDRLERADQWGLMADEHVLTDLVWLYLGRDRLADAEAAVRRLVSDASEKPEPWRGLAGVLRRAKRADKAEEAYRRALAIDPEHAASRRELAVMLTSLGRHDEAIELYREAIAMSPDDTLWSIELSDLLSSIGRVEQAKAELSRLVERSPNSARGHLSLGKVMLRTKEWDNGVAHLRQAVELDPTLADAHYNLGYALLDRRRTVDAITHLQEAARLSPAVALYHYNLGVAIFMAGRPAEAEPHIRQAIRLSPDDPDAYGFLAILLEQLGDHRGSVAASEESERLRREGH